jgi:hypothetical protein
MWEIYENEIKVHTAEIKVDAVRWIEEQKAVDSSRRFTLVRVY